MRQSFRKLGTFRVVFDDPNAVASGGLLLPISACRMARAEATAGRQHPPRRPARAHQEAKTSAAAASALVGRDSIDNASVVRSRRPDVVA
jgi:hypothetical protein